MGALSVSGTLEVGFEAKPTHTAQGGLSSPSLTQNPGKTVGTHNVLPAAASTDTTTRGATAHGCIWAAQFLQGVAIFPQRQMQYVADQPS